MNNWQQYLIQESATIREALAQINDIGDPDCVLFVTDAAQRLLGTLSDGDIRRGLINNVQITEAVSLICNRQFSKIINGHISFEYVQQCKQNDIFSLPDVDGEGRVINVINLHQYRASLPMHAVIMAGGRGERLMPLTRETPKPMLPVGGKPIIEHNIDRLINYGVHHIHISINYLGEKITAAYGDGSAKGISIDYVKEDQPLGTIGSISLIPGFSQDCVLVMNSDLLTNIDFADFYRSFTELGADMAVATVPYHIDLPYAIMEINGDKVTSLKEKPRYTYFANAGIYLIKKEVLPLIPANAFYNTTDLMEQLIASGRRLINYPILGYWLDIGKHEDYTKAQHDILHLNL
jgi:dTDP-glucose pyrophosphorylase